jgi:hypothetical protein
MKHHESGSPFHAVSYEIKLAAQASGGTGYWIQSPYKVSGQIVMMKSAYLMAGFISTLLFQAEY